MMDIFFTGWAGPIRILVAAPFMYVAIIAVIRISGKRTTSQMNNFDWVVTVAIGSIVGSGAMLNGVTVFEALLAISLLLLLQWALTSAIPHLAWVRRLAKAEPRLLVHDGEFLRGQMAQERVTEAEVLAAIRQNGLAEIGEVQWAILETDATVSVIPKGDRDFSDVELAGVAEQLPEGADT